MFSPRFLVISLGNPLPQYSSLHSAGHFALKGLSRLIGNPPFHGTKFGKERCLVSPGAQYTLIQSPTLMNISGQFVAGAWNYMAKQHDPKQLCLVVVHDELEKDLGAVNLIPWDRSPRGHNGVKSIKSRMARVQETFPDSPFARITVGIGRPKERDPTSVAKYVLDPISPATQTLLTDEVPVLVRQRLVELENEWATEFKK